MKNFLLLITAIFASQNLFADIYKFSGDPKGIEFVISKNKKKSDEEFGKTDVVGNFSKFSGSFDYDAKTRMVKDLNVEIDVASINTQMEKRDKHLRSADFFDVDKHPKATFVSKAGQSFAVAADGSAKIDGTLTIKGVSKDLSLKVMAQINGDEIKIMPHKESYAVAFDRNDFGISYNIDIDEDTLGNLVGKFKSFLGQKVIGNVTQLNVSLVAKKGK